MAFLLGRSDASMFDHDSSAGVAAEVLVFIDEQTFLSVAREEYHFPISNIHLAEFVGVLLSAHLLHLPAVAATARDFVSAQGLPPRFASAVLHTDRQSLCPDCQGCPLLQALHRRIMRLYNLETGQIWVQWTRRADPWMLPVNAAARRRRSRTVFPVAFTELGSMLPRNSELQVALLEMAAAWLTRPSSI